MNSEEKYEKTKRGIDTLIKRIMRDVEDDSLRYKSVSKLLEVAEILNGEEDGERIGSQTGS